MQKEDLEKPCSTNIRPIIAYFEKDHGQENRLAEVSKREPTNKGWTHLDSQSHCTLNEALWRFMSTPGQAFRGLRLLESHTKCYNQILPSYANGSPFCITTIRVSDFTQYDG